jgi:tetratricopeptide (TPR) repeat protein
MVDKNLIRQGNSLGEREELTFHPLLFEVENENHPLFLQKQGETKLLQGDIKGLKFFDLALSLDSTNIDLLLRQGLSLFAFAIKGNVKKHLLLANKKFKQAITISPEFFPAWHAFGNTLHHLGRTFKQHHYFLEAAVKYKKAIALSQGQPEFTLAELFWSYGQVMIQIGDQSEEISDLNTALDAHAKASSLNENLPASFWQDFGRVSLKLGIQINDIRLYLKSVNCHKNALAHSISNFESWYYLGETLSHLYELTHDDDHFCQGNECFTNAAKLHPQNDQIWLSWAKLLLSSGKRIGDTKRLHSAIEKCSQAHRCNQQDQEVLIVWSETLSALAIVTDRLDHIHEGENKASEALEKFGETTEVCYAQGINLFSFGKYYNDVDYYYQAIEKFQEGLSINRAHHKLWFHIGYTYAIVAEIEDDPILFERAGKFYTRAINLQSDSNYYFEYASSLRKLAEYNQDKGILETALLHFEQAFNLQKNAVYLHPDWLYSYALALDLMGDFVDEDKYYVKSIEILKRVLMLDPDFPDIHYRLALVYGHLGELTDLMEVYQRALSHFKIAFQGNEENEQLILDWALCLINLAEISPSTEDREQLWKEAEYKLIQSAKLGNPESYYHLACLYSLMRLYEKSMYFLEKAEHFEALPALDDVLEDDWLENLRQTELFRAFINHLDLET